MTYNKENDSLSIDEEKVTITSDTDLKMLGKKRINDIVFITRIVIKILIVLKANMLILFSTF